MKTVSVGIARGNDSAVNAVDLAQVSLTKHLPMTVHSAVGVGVYPYQCVDVCCVSMLVGEVSMCQYGHVAATECLCVCVTVCVCVMVCLCDSVCMTVGV